jgi:hypothetical protein
MTESIKHDRIFLQAIDDDDFFYPARGYEDDVEYIRADIMADQLAELLKEANQQLAAKDADIEEESHIRERMGELLALTAIALKGPNEELSLHSWHDLPEKAEELQQKLAANDAAIKISLDTLKFILRYGVLDKSQMVREAIAAIKELGK